MKKRITLWAVALLATASAFAQTTVLMPYNTGVQSTFSIAPPATCFFNFFDNGGSAAAYSASSNSATSIVTFAPSAATNRVRATFTSFACETSFDALYVKDGATTGAALINSGLPIGFTALAGGWWGTQAPQNVAANTVQATNAAGALTFQFASDGSVQSAGWAAVVSQVPANPCQVVAPANVTVSTSAGVCQANAVNVATPSYNPAACNTSYSLQYSVNGGTPVVLGAAPPATITLINLPKGVHTIVWSLVDPCGGAVISSATSTVTVSDLTPPVITCPGNITINLGPGECFAQYSYQVTATDNCPYIIQQAPVQFPLTFGANGNGVTFTWAGNTAPGGFYFNLTNNAATDYSVTGFGIRFGPSQFGAVPSPQTIQVYTAPTFVGNMTNAGAWTNIGPATVTVAGTNSQLSQVNITSQVSVPAGQTRGFYIFGQNACPLFDFNFGTSAPITSGPFTFTGGNISTGLFVQQTSFPGTNCIGNVQVQYAIAGNIPVVQTSGLPSGSEFPRGVTTNCFTATDAAGNTASCCFNVTVNEYPNAVTSLVCNDHVNFALDENCSGVVLADDILEGGPYGCYDDYIVELDKTAPFGNGPWVPAVAGPGDVGKTYQVRVTDPDTGNKCWGTIKFEDKLPPVLICDPLLLPCNFDPTPGNSGSAPLNKVYSATGLPVSLVDFQTQTFTLPVDLTTVYDVDVLVKVSGPVWFGNIHMEVESPQGTIVTFWDQIGGCNGPIWARFDDEGLTNLLCTTFNSGQNAAIPFNLGLLSSFDGENGQGNWQVRISDVDGFGDVSSIEAVQLYINGLGVITVDFPHGIANPITAFPNGANTYLVPAGQLDACSDVTLTYIDTKIAKDCASGLTQTINRKWTAKDASGNTSTCIQQIDQFRPSLSDVTLPPDYDGIDAPMFQCTDNAYPTPQWIEGQGLQGYPYVYNVPEGCNINWDYEDQVLEICDGTYKIRRDWTIIDWCAGTGFEYTQLLKVVDNAGPSIACPANLTVSTDPFTCCATTDLPDVIITDNCSHINNISGMIITFDPQTGLQTGMTQIGGTLTTFPGNNLWNLDTLGRYGYTSCLPVGTHTVIYQAEDDCGNTSTCSFRLTVRDYVPPVAACTEFTTVAIGVDDPFDCYEPSAGGCGFAGVTWVKASTFDQGSYDNCGTVKFTVRRMAPYSECIQGLNQVNGHPDCNDVFPDFPSEFERAINEQDSIKFYCCEVGTTQTVVLTVYQVNPDGTIGIGPDGSPVSNQCMVQVEVQDKIKPVCVSPANVTVSCENFDPSLWVYGKPNVYDNCCLDTSKVYQGQCGLTHTANYNLFDTVCNRGTITRTFRAFDCHGLSSQCTQRIIVNYEQDYFVKFPNDVIVTVCDGTGNYGEPTFFGEDCELLASSYTDEIFTVVPDACYKIERTWKVINWCTYNPNLGCIYVPNPTPNATTNHPSNLPGPIVSACGTIAPWNPTVVKINSTDATSTNYCTFYDANANCYIYKQIIKVIDTKAPVAQCPASPVTFCDVTPNNPQLWNEMYWWDNTIQSHDLCEGPSDLTITASDACSGANINIEYLLFLDLDGNGSMETVVSSTNLPTWNTVNFGNATNPNFGGGTPRSFDERPVPFNQKYGFAIQETTSGVNKTAAVRWNTQQSQTSYTIPELPYGTHKIKWIISDGCGNESVCEYQFIVKDCKKPTVVCLNGLSVNIMPTQMIQLWATDFLQYVDDNCTPAGQIKVGIVKSSESTGVFPVDANGNPITNVVFTCAELGTQPVQLWAIDAAGNADYCETYVIVQDNAGNCGAKASIAGALKTEANNGLEDATIDLQGSMPGVPPISMFDYSDQTGKYEFSNAVPFTSNVTVTPIEDDNHINGVSTFDLVLISKHILGLEPLTSPYQMIAADANKSGSITTFDIVELRKLILGVYTELPNNTSWRFVDKSFTFPNAANPFQSAFPENKTIGAIAASQTNDDFVSVKIGDINGNAVANNLMSTEDRAAGTLMFDVQDRAVKAGETFDVTFKAAEKVQGYQFSMNFPGMEVVDVVPGAKMTMDNFGVFAADKVITTSFDADAAGEFTVRFRATQSGMLSNLLAVSSRITKAEAYNVNNDRLDVAFRFNGENGSTVAGVGFELYQNQPNPFVNKTAIGFHLPEAATATLTVYDETGRTLFTQKGDFAKGYNQIAIDRALLNTTGMMYYKLETTTDSATKKMIQTK